LRAAFVALALAYAIACAADDPPQPPPAATSSPSDRRPDPQKVRAAVEQLFATGVHPAVPADPAAQSDAAADAADRTMSRALEARLRGDARLAGAAGLHVSAHAGVVVLTGRVSSPGQLGAARALAQQVPGVQRVDLRGVQVAAPE
jgi:hypothetical protein